MDFREEFDKILRKFITTDVNWISWLLLVYTTDRKEASKQ
jgi:hypothetical protein